MAFDLNLTTACDHRVFRELNVLDKDQHTLHPDKPVAVTSTLNLFSCNNLLPPSLYTITDDPVNKMSKIIYFNEKWRSPSDYFEVTYQTLPGYCAKCVASNYLDDISYNVLGGLMEIRDEYLLMQNLEKFVVTKANTNPFHTFIGTELVGLIGSKIDSFSFLKSQITAEITKAINNFQGLQNQYKNTGRIMTTGETLQTIQSITVVQDPNDPTIIRANIVAIAQSGKTVEFSQVLKIRNQ